MITIDKLSQSNTLIVTVTELTTIDNPFYLMVLQSPYTNKTYRLQLPDNTSQYKGRYDEFILNTAVFNEIDAGTYSYSIYQSAVETLDESSLGKPCEIGYLQVVSANSEQYVSIQEQETDNDYIVYQPN